MFRSLCREVVALFQVDEKAMVGQASDCLLETKGYRVGHTCSEKDTIQVGESRYAPCVKVGDQAYEDLG